MKKIFVACLLTCAMLAGHAQQRPHYTQYILNNYIINPAVAGIENYTDVKLSHRHQWVGLDGAPVTTYLTVHAPLRKSDYPKTTATTFGPSGQNPRGKNYASDYEAAEPHHGIGFTMLNDRTGPLNRFSVAGTYAYHLGLSARSNLSMGISVGMQNMTLDAAKLQFATTQIDPAVTGSGYLNRWKADISAGIWYYTANSFVGLAAQNIVPQKITYAEKNDSVGIAGKLVPHLFITAGHRFFLNDDLSLLPSAMLRYVSPLPLGFDINAKLQYRDFIWLGASYRKDDGIAAMFGFAVNSSFNFGYSYDITTSRLNTVSKGSHELVLGFLLGNRYGDWCPRNMW
jgi:type IX secretion system PorP/SprF family membrane protein